MIVTVGIGKHDGDGDCKINNYEGGSDYTVSMMVTVVIK